MTSEGSWHHKTVIWVTLYWRYCDFRDYSCIINLWTQVGFIWKMFSLAVFLMLSLRHAIKIASRAIFVAAVFCRDDQTLSCCICVNWSIWLYGEQKKRVVSHAVVSCRVVYVWTGLYVGIRSFATKQVLSYVGGKYNFVSKYYFGTK